MEIDFTRLERDVEELRQHIARDRRFDSCWGALSCLMWFVGFGGLVMGIALFFAPEGRQFSIYFLLLPGLTAIIVLIERRTAYMSLNRLKNRAAQLGFEIQRNTYDKPYAVPVDPQLQDYLAGQYVAYKSRRAASSEAIQGMLLESNEYLVPYCGIPLEQPDWQECDEEYRGTEEDEDYDRLHWTI